MKVVIRCSHFNKHPVIFFLCSSGNHYHPQSDLSVIWGGTVEICPWIQPWKFPRWEGRVCEARGLHAFLYRWVKMIVKLRDKTKLLMSLLLEVTLGHSQWASISTCRPSYVPRRGSGSYGALPHPGDSAEEVQVHLAWGCRRARLHSCLWDDPDPETLFHEGPTQINYSEKLLRQRFPKDCNKLHGNIEQNLTFRYKTCFG